MIRFQKFCTLAVAGALAAACSSSKDDSSSSTGGTQASAVASAILSVSSKVQEANIAQYQSSHASSLSMKMSDVSAFSANTLTEANWLNTGLSIPIANLICGDSSCTTPNTSPKDWVADMLNPTFANSNGANVGLMGRFLKNMGFVCEIGQLFGSGSALPDAGSGTKTVTIAEFNVAAAICGEEPSTGFYDPETNSGTLQSMTLDYDVTDVTGTFDKKIHFHNSLFDNTLFVKVGDIYRVMSVETNTNQGYPQISRYYVQFDKTSSEVKFEGLERGFPSEASGSHSSGGFYFYRIHLNDSTKEMRIMAENGGRNCTAASGGVCTTESSQNYTLWGGHGNTQEPLATMGFYVYNSGGGGGLTNAVGCIDMSTGNHSSDSACSGRDLDLAASDTLVNDGSTGVASYKAPDASSGTKWNLTETVGAISFDASTIFTAAPTN